VFEPGEECADLRRIVPGCIEVQSQAGVDLWGLRDDRYRSGRARNPLLRGIGLVSAERLTASEVGLKDRREPGDQRLI
jgi:hypothetical protein